MRRLPRGLLLRKALQTGLYTLHRRYTYLPRRLLLNKALQKGPHRKFGVGVLALGVALPGASPAEERRARPQARADVFDFLADSLGYVTYTLHQGTRRCL